MTECTHSKIIAAIDAVGPKYQIVVVYDDPRGGVWRGPVRDSYDEAEQDMIREVERPVRGSVRIQHIGSGRIVTARSPADQKREALRAAPLNNTVSARFQNERTAL